MHDSPYRHRTVDGFRISGARYLQLLTAEDFTYNFHALKHLSGEVSIPLKTDVLQIGGGGGLAAVTARLAIVAIR